MKSLLFVLSLICIFFVQNSFSQIEVEKTLIMEKTTLANAPLVLNGVGIRKATIFKVKVYVGALYVQAKSQDYTILDKSPWPRQIAMHFIRDVDKKDLQKGWNDAFFSAHGEDKTYEGPLSKLNDLMDDIKKGQSIIIDFFADKVEVSFPGKEKATISVPGFNHQLFAIWFVNAKDENLRDGLLGKILIKDL